MWAGAGALLAVGAGAAMAAAWVKQSQAPGQAVSQWEIGNESYGGTVGGSSVAGSGSWDRRSADIARYVPLRAVARHEPRGEHDW